MPSLPPSCTGCWYAEGRTLHFIPPDPETSRVRLVAWGEMGGEEETRLSRGFVGPSGRALRKAARRAGLKCWSAWPNDAPLPRELEEIACRNVVLCRGRDNNFPGDEVAQECLRRHLGGCDAAPNVTPSTPCPPPSGGSLTTAPDATLSPLPWIVCGAHAIKALTGLTLPPLKVRGSLLPTSRGRWATATFHPATLVRGRVEDSTMGKSMDYLEPMLAVDIARALDCAEPVVPHVRVEQPATVLSAFLLDKPKLTSVDIEGGQGVPTILGLSWSPGEAWTMPWSDACKPLLRAVFKYSVPVFHNAAYDVTELLEAGVEPPAQWVDTINLAALYNPSVELNLQAQVLSWVTGTVTWKGLIDHKKGAEYEEGAIAVYRGLWTEVLTRLGRRVPATAQEWFLFYNGLDVAWTLQLALSLSEHLRQQGRFAYYQTVMQPLQRSLWEMGRRGFPVEPGRLDYHRVACARLQRMASGILKDAAKEYVGSQAEFWRVRVEGYEALREGERAGGQRKFSRGDELTKVRTKLKTCEKGFDINSPKQRAGLLYDWLGLPATYTEKGNPTVKDTFLEELLVRMTRTDDEGKAVPTVKPKRGTQAEAVRVVRACLAEAKWSHWESTFLHPVVDEKEGFPKIRSSYSQHRTETGRVSSGVNNSDPEKMGLEKVQQSQNIPKRLRDAFIAQQGHALVGGDWAAIQWALAMWYMSKLETDGYHLALLDAQQRGEMDPHSFLAAHAFGVPVEEIGKGDHRRQVCKGYTFGYLFGGTPRGLARNVGHPEKVGLRVCAAHDRAFRGARWRSATVVEATRKHHIQTPLGWRRYFWGWKPKAEEILASIIQATEGDLLKWVLASVERTIPKGWSVYTNTHDFLALHVPEGDVERGVVFLRSKMEQSVPWLDGRSWRASVKVGRNWREVS